MMTYHIIRTDFWRSEHRTGGSTDLISTCFWKANYFRDLNKYLCHPARRWWGREAGRRHQFVHGACFEPE